MAIGDTYWRERVQYPRNLVNIIYGWSLRLQHGRGRPRGGLFGFHLGSSSYGYGTSREGGGWQIIKFVSYKHNYKLQLEPKTYIIQVEGLFNPATSICIIDGAL